MSLIFIHKSQDKNNQPFSLTFSQKWLTLLLCLLLTACVTTNKDITSEQQRLKIQLDEHIQEWQALKPTIERLSKSQQDLNFLITELDKLSSIDNTPSNEQLNAETKFTPPAIQDKQQPVHSNNKNIEFGIHIASYQQQKNLVLGWYIYKKKYQALLQNKKAMMQLVDISGKQYRRLIVAPFHSAQEAQRVCKNILDKGSFCQVISYEI